MAKNRFVKVIIVVLLVLLTPWFLMLGARAVFDYQNQKYAENYFSFMPFDSVLESREWLSGALGCTYAVVSLENSAPFDPPEQWVDRSIWHKTPLKFKEEAMSSQCRNLICQCEADWNPLHYQLLERALREPGSFYYLGWKQPPHEEIHQDVILIYSKTEGVAAWVRFGD